MVVFDLLYEISVVFAELRSILTVVVSKRFQDCNKLKGLYFLFRSIHFCLHKLLFKPLETILLWLNILLLFLLTLFRFLYIIFCQKLDLLM